MRIPVGFFWHFFRHFSRESSSYSLLNPFRSAWTPELPGIYFSIPPQIPPANSQGFFAGYFQGFRDYSFKGIPFEISTEITSSIHECIPNGILPRIFLGFPLGFWKFLTIFLPVLPPNVFLGIWFGIPLKENFGISVNVPSRLSSVLLFGNVPRSPLAIFKMNNKLFKSLIWREKKSFSKVVDARVV